LEAGHTVVGTVRLAALHDEIQAWEPVSRSTDYL
jgi:hypothetical protein